MSDNDLKEFTAEELANSGYTAFQGFVYDLADFAVGHPGGSELITEWRGRDGSDALLDVHPGGKAFIKHTLGPKDYTVAVKGKLPRSPHLRCLNQYVSEESCHRHVSVREEEARGREKEKEPQPRHAHWRLVEACCGRRCSRYGRGCCCLRKGEWGVSRRVNLINSTRLDSLELADSVHNSTSRSQPISGMWL